MKNKIKSMVPGSPQARIELLAGGLTYRLLPRVVRYIVVATFTKPYRTGIGLLVTRIQRLWKSNGKLFVVKYLKVSYLSVVQATAGRKYIRQPGDPIVSVDQKGYPRFIPKALRAEITCDRPADRTWELTQCILSIFNLYRAILIPGKLKLETITDTFSGMSDVVNHDQLRESIEMLVGRIPKIRIRWEVYHSSYSGPNSSISSLGMWEDLVAWSRQGTRFWVYAWGVVKHFSNRSIFIQFLFWSIITGLLSMPWWYRQKKKRVKGDYAIGTLAEKLEAAGKIRVFAITDYWTQSILQPLHRGLFDILSSIPMDATFDQEGALKRAREISRNNSGTWSFDLSAATDRLPIALQEQVITILVDKDFAKSWRGLLTDRDWIHKGNKLRYAVGQPMGALSSWGILAFTHHILVQLSALRAGFRTRFEGYTVLGDDVVIFDRAVAKEYVKLIEILGVTINLSKSVVSDEGWFEFAKRICHADIDISPLGAKAVIISSINPKWASVGVVDAAQKGTFDITDGITMFLEMVGRKFIKPSQVEPLYEGLFGPGGLQMQAPLLTAWADRRLKHLRVQSGSTEAMIVEILLTMWEERLSKFYISSMDKQREDRYVPMKLWDVEISDRIRRILSWLHPISWWWDYKCQLIREEMWDFKHWRSLQIAEFEDAKDDYYGIRGGYIALLDKFDLSKFNPTFATTRVEKVRELAINMGELSNKVNLLTQERLERHRRLWVRKQDFDRAKAVRLAEWNTILRETRKDLSQSKS